MSVSSLTYALSSVTATLILVSAACFMLLGIDDFILDVAFWVHKGYRSFKTFGFKPLSLEDLRAKEQQRIAIFIPCWHEYDIVDKMVELASRTVQYARYEIFIGVYPNDPRTIEKAQAAARRFPRVQVVINERDGPTTKAQNLNQMWKAMKAVEGDDPFAIVVLHDVEDVIHPVSLLLYNYLIPRRDMVQLPVFPLERPWSKWTAWTYADEFAENHLKDLTIRELFGSFVPCAGVGCAFGRRALEASCEGRDELFPTASLTEDYQLGLDFRQRGLSTIMVHQRLAHKAGERYDMTAASYVATREFFPDTFATAVRQKARWIIGICFQAWQETGWTGNAFTRYTLYRDRKAIVSNLFVLVGYVAFAGAIVLLIWSRFDHRVAQPYIGGRWWEWPLVDAVFVLTVLRLMQKAYFVASIYGARQGALALVRVPWGGLVNAAATARAWWLVIRAAATGTPLVWNKTAHVFPTRAALGEYRRQLGEVLIESDIVTSDDISLALAERQAGERIGETLVRLGYLTQRQLTGAVAKQIGAADGTQDDLLPSREALELVPLEAARRLRVLPLRVEDGHVTVAVDDEPSNDLDAYLNHLPYPYRILIVESQRLVHAIERSYTFGDERRKPLGVYLLDRGFLTRDALELALAEQDRLRTPLFELLVERRMLTRAHARAVLEEYFGLPFVTPPVDARICAQSVEKLPASIFKDAALVPYELDGAVFVASPFPLERRTKEALAWALPSRPTYVAASMESLAPLRRQVFAIVERRKRLGRMLVDHNLVTNEDIAQALEARSEGERLGETLVRLGVLREGDLRGVLERQATDAPPPAAGERAVHRPLLGVYLLERGFVTRRELDELLALQDRERKPLFAMMVEKQMLSNERIRRVVEEYFHETYVDRPVDARVPIEALQRIPTKILRENLLAVYETAGVVTVAAPFPIAGPIRETIADATGGSIAFVVASMDSLAPLRKKMLHEIDVRQISTTVP